MSIRFKILVACLSLTLITVLMGAFAQRSQSELGTIATRIYDEAFMAVSYLREAQNGLMKLNVAVDQSAMDQQGADLKTLVAEAVPDILGSLDVAEDRAMSAAGRQAVDALRLDVEGLSAIADGASAVAMIAELDRIQGAFDVAVEIYAGDGYLYRRSVGENIEQSNQRTLIAIVGSVAVAFLITLLLSRSIVPAVRAVVRVATSIASGHLDNVVVSKDRSEMGQMLQALSAMQDSIRSLMAEQASSHADEMAVQHTRLARHDVLTGLPNRVRFREYMEEAMPRSRSRPFTILSLDLDGFKAVNDNLGHPAGDALLQLVARRLEACAEDADIVARLGGDEFVIVQQHSQQAEVVDLAERLVEALHMPFEVDGHRLVIGVSIGIASTTDLADPAEHGTPDTLLKDADLALYRAKAGGRGTYRFFQAEMDARLQARRRLELDLQTALENQQFELAFQPLVDTRGGRNRVAGFEALLRWHNPVRGLVSPAEFIPVAEDMGVIKEIGAWVLDEACREAATWPGDVKVAVNLSPVQFASNSLVDLVAHALDRSGLAPERLELEITESLLLQDDSAVLATLHRLRHLGARIAMDDFGTGYSSLSYLQRFPFDKIKIDQAFIRQLSESSDSTAIVRAVIGLGRSLGINILAEGVETAQQLAILQAEGCWDVQGFLFSPAKPAAALPELMRSIGAGRAKGRSAA